MLNSNHRCNIGRPRNPRCIAGEYALQVFKPAGVPFNQLTEIELGLDELEAIRLVDIEGLYQERAAQQLGVSRSTLGRILRNGRNKVAQAIVESKALVIGKPNRTPEKELEETNRSIT